MELCEMIEYGIAKVENRYFLGKNYTFCNIEDCPHDHNFMVNWELKGDEFICKTRGFIKKSEIESELQKLTD